MTKSDRLARQTLTSLELFQDISPAAPNDVLRSARVRRLPEETRIVDQGDTGARADAPIEGVIRIRELSTQRVEQRCPCRSAACSPGWARHDRRHLMQRPDSLSGPGVFIPRFARAQALVLAVTISFQQPDGRRR